MGLFSRNKPEPKPAPQPTRSSDEYHRLLWGDNLTQSLGTCDLDELLRLCAPKHEATLDELRRNQRQIIANQQKILEELANLRHFYQTPEKASAPSYFHSGIR